MFGLSPAPASVGVARRNVRELLSEWGTCTDTCDNAVLVASELVTNALTHTASEWIVCRLRTAGDRLHIEVEDQSRGLTLPALRRPGPDDQGGRGLMLVGMLSSDWGVRDSVDGSGRVVWAVLTSEPVPPHPVPSQPLRSVASKPKPKPMPTKPTPAQPMPTKPTPSEPTSSESREPASTGRSTYLTRPTPHSAEGHLHHGTAARP
ncbi:ATP-binding protein [Streptomyces sp. NBC_00878]|uniref:ATP-binding protein n=1 Tax=Streptomyces sp. NBC_00878 TaxID=2975854 RepID=UPI002257AD02|nr:ATP-binding protein [Streptomyces sp. NBC_00878]MCX4904619.1 ATP-binding protein [Streptomyces sp. NBC_00878]